MKNQKKGFIAVLVIVSVTFITLGVVYSSEKVRFNLEFFSGAFQKFNTFDTSGLKTQIILSEKIALNSDVITDSEMCLDGPLTILENGSKSCYNNTTLLTEAPAAGSDGIMDAGDNNDFKCSYFEDVDSGKIDIPASKKCDNDDEYRLKIQGIIAPETYDTVLVIDNETIELIGNNTLNFGPNIHRQLPVNNEFTLDFSINHNNSKIRIYTIDKGNSTLSENQIIANDFIESDITNLVGTLQKSGTLGFGDDFIFNTIINYYVIILENSGIQNLEYSISGTEILSGESVYLVPIDDSGSEIETNFKYFIEGEYSTYGPLDVKYINY